MNSKEKLKHLTTELKLIEYWDTEYYKRTDRTAVEIEAFKCRLHRRQAILAEIIRLEETVSDRRAEC